MKSVFFQTKTCGIKGELEIEILRKCKMFENHNKYD